MIAGVLLHIGLVWIPDQTIWSYVAVSAPGYMWAGLGAMTALLALVALALPGSRRFWHERRSQFRRWHWGLAIALVALTIWHVVGSGFYVSRLEGIVLCAVAGAAVTLDQRFQGESRLGWKIGAACGLAPLVFLVIKHT